MARTTQGNGRRGVPTNVAEQRRMARMRAQVLIADLLASEGITEAAVNDLPVNSIAWWADTAQRAGVPAPTPIVIADIQRNLRARFTDTSDPFDGVTDKPVQFRGCDR